jgi:hypothetical protein
MTSRRPPSSQKGGVAFFSIHGYREGESWNSYLITSNKCGRLPGEWLPQIRVMAVRFERRPGVALVGGIGPLGVAG